MKTCSGFTWHFWIVEDSESEVDGKEEYKGNMWWSDDWRMQDDLVQ